MTSALEKQLLQGEITPEEALERAEVLATPIGEIALEFESRPLKIGFPTFEHYCLLREGKPDLVVVAARPGVGKTALVCQIALNLSKTKNVLIYSLEMTKEQLNTRMTAVESEKAVKSLSHLSTERLREIRAALASRRLAIDDTNGIHINQIVSRTLDYHRRKPLSLVIVDYMQIVQADTRRSKKEEVGIIAEKLKDLAKQIGCPVIGVAQMNRNTDSRILDLQQARERSRFYKRDQDTTDMEEELVYRPTMSDLADSAEIEKWADIIFFLHRQYVFDRTRPGEADVFVAKNRHGDLSDFTLKFSGEITKFFDGGLL